MLRRADRIRKTMMKEISDIIRRNVKDPRISGIVSVTDIELSSDFSNAKIFVSFFGSEEEKEKIVEVLGENAPKIRHEVGKRVKLRHTPVLTFVRDDSLERGARITELIDKIARGEL